MVQLVLILRVVDSIRARGKNIDQLGLARNIIRCLRLDGNQLYVEPPKFIVEQDERWNRAGE
jgi:hypothetical protein